MFPLRAGLTTRRTDSRPGNRSSTTRSSTISVRLLARGLKFLRRGLRPPRLTRRISVTSPERPLRERRAGN
jgi:hypothetical protein